VAGEVAAGTREALLAHARRTLDAALTSRPEPPAPEGDAERQRRGAFVTLSVRQSGDLRGCIGHVAADLPLGEVVGRMAIAAAFEDPRFPPVTAAELPGLRIEISVLTVPVRLLHADPGSGAIVPGRDGLIVQAGHRQGLLLPQVAVEYGWDAEALLTATCRKARLSPSAWRSAGTAVFTFQAEVFGE
jgi:AmmeMemoRadiSam system protein A